MDHDRIVLLTGATGYIGGRLLRRLEERGMRVRCLARRPDYLRDRVGPSTEVVSGDLLDLSSLRQALQGTDTAFYLVHSMGSTGRFEEQDRQAAENFAVAAREAGLKRIIYLGGLGEGREELSAHLRSRHEVGEILRSSGIQVLEFRASIILGSGSLSFEMIRALVERLPIMILPRWVSVPAQPIAIADVLRYLLAAVDHTVEGSRIYEIGGKDRVSYGDLMREYARQRGLRRRMIPVPVLTPYLSSLWLGLVTPLYARVGRKLIESIRHPTIVRDDTAQHEFAIEPLGYREAIASALRNEDRALIETHWSDALSAGGRLPEWDGVQLATRFVDTRSAEVEVPPAKAFAPIRRIGGKTGWYFGDWLWRLRGTLDLLFGGVGMRRGRRDPDSLRNGDVLDFWRVDAYEPDRRLLLHAEMKLPGRAWLEFAVEPTARGSTIHQTAIYEPLGVCGRAYWYVVYPLHQLVFARMLRGIASAARVPSSSRR
jgi:uncharacterized protein YbjT (DUF2867 family)